MNWSPPATDLDESTAILSAAGREGLISLVAVQLGQLRARGTTLTAHQAIGVRELLQPASHHVVTKVDSDAASSGPSGCTITETGQRLGMTRWGVRKAILRGDLTGSQASARAPYVVTELSIAAFARKRARAARSTQDDGWPDDREEDRGAAAR